MFVIHTFSWFWVKIQLTTNGHHILNVPLRLCWSQWCKSQPHILFIAKLPIACNSKVWSNSYSAYPASNEIPCIYAWDMKLNCVIVISMKLWNDAFQEFWCWSHSARVYKIPWKAQTGHLRHPLAPRWSTSWPERTGQTWSRLQRHWMLDVYKTRTIHYIRLGNWATAL